MSNWKNSQSLRSCKTWADAFKIVSDTSKSAPTAQKSYENIPVFPYGYTDPRPKSEDKPLPGSEVKPANSKLAKSKSTLPGHSDPRPSAKQMLSLPLPDWAPRDFKRLHLQHCFLPINASEWQIKNLFQQIHHHFGSIGAHVFKTSGPHGILPTTRWPLPPDSEANDTYYIIRMKDTRKPVKDEPEKDEPEKDTRKTENLKPGQPLKAFVEFLVEHKNNYCVAWRIIKKISEFKTAKWCCFSDHNYLSEQEPFKGKVEITNYVSGYSWELNDARVWTNFFKSLFKFLYELYEKPKSSTTTKGKRLFQTLFVFFFEGKRFPAIENFNRANWKKKLELHDASVLTIPLHNAVNAWSSCSDLVFLMAIVMLEDKLARDLMAMKPNAKYPNLPHHSLVPLFEQFRRHRSKAEARCAAYAEDIKGLHRILRLEKDEVSEIHGTESYGFRAFERLMSGNCLNLLNFNHDLVLAVKAREGSFQGLLGVDLAPPEKHAEKPKVDNSATCTESSSGAAGAR